MNVRKERAESPRGQDPPRHPQARHACAVGEPRPRSLAQRLRDTPIRAKGTEDCARGRGGAQLVEADAEQMLRAPPPPRRGHLAALQLTPTCLSAALCRGLSQSCRASQPRSLARPRPRPEEPGHEHHTPSPSGGPLRVRSAPAAGRADSPLARAAPFVSPPCPHAQLGSRGHPPHNRVCARVSAHEHLCLRVHVPLCVPASVRAHLCLCIHVRLCAPVSHVCACVCTCAPVSVHLCVHLWETQAES